MIGLANLLNIAASGLNAATEAMQTVSNNTANVNTPGYDTQSVIQVARFGAPGGVGAGTQVTSIARAFDQFVAQQVVRAGSSNQAAQVLQSNAQNLLALFPVASGGAGGLSASIDSFFSSLNQLSTDPSSVANRSVFLGSAQSLAGQFNSLGNQLAAQLNGIDDQTAAAVQQVNALTQQIALLNKTIVAQTASPAGPANGLLDQRDQLVNQLGQTIGISVTHESNGSLDVYTTGGAALVDGAVATSLAVKPDTYGSGESELVNGSTGQDLTSSVSGGTIGGLLASRALVESAQDGVGAVAASLSAAVNAQQALGLDLNGNPGAALFSVAAPTVYAAQSNTGGATLTASLTDPGSLAGGDLIVTKTATGFEATDRTTGNVTDLGNGPTLNVDGLTLTVSGNAAVGDSFKVAPTATAAQTFKVTTNDPAAIAAASAYVATAGDNAGGVQATGLGAVAGDALPTGTVIVPAGDFGQNLSVNFTSQNDFQVLDPVGAVVATGSLDADGKAAIAVAYPGSSSQYATFSLAGGPAAAGDSFSLTPGGPGSSGNIAGLAAIASDKIVSGQTLDGAYAALVADIGQRSQGAQIAAQAAQGVLTQATNAQQSVSGVNLDEQAADLVSYQQAYQASAQVIATAQTLFQNLLSAVQA